MKPSHIEHIGIAVSSLDEVIPYYEQLLGQKCYSIEEVDDYFARMNDCRYFLYFDETRETEEFQSQLRTVNKYLWQIEESIQNEELRKNIENLLDNINILTVAEVLQQDAEFFTKICSHEKWVELDTLGDVEALEMLKDQLMDTNPLF